MFERIFRRGAALWLALLLTASAAAQQQQPTQAARDDVRPAPPAAAPADAAALVTEFDVNGLKVLVKRRAGSQTAVAGLFIRGGAQNVTPETAGVEALMLDSASEASRSFPRERLRKELARMGTSVSFGVNYD